MHASIHVIFSVLVVLATGRLSMKLAENPSRRPTAEIAAIVILFLVGAYIYWPEPERIRKERIIRDPMTKNDEWLLYPDRYQQGGRQLAKLFNDFENA